MAVKGVVYINKKNLFGSLNRWPYGGGGGVVNGGEVLGGGGATG